MHYCEIARRNPSNQWIVYCPDTDVFSFLIFRYPSQPNALRFRTGKGSNLCNFSIGSCYEGHGSCRENTLLVFHIFTVCYQTERCMRKSKTSWWKNFMKAADNTLKTLGDLDKNCLLKSCMLFFLNLRNICIYCQDLNKLM